MFTKLWDDWQRNRKARHRNQQKCAHLLQSLNDTTALQQASVLALAMVFRHKVIDRSRQLSDVIYSPENSRLKKLRLVYELLEAIQERMESEMQNVQKHFHDIPTIANQSPQDHWLHSMQGMDLWLITLGAAMDKHQKPVATRIWQILDASHAQLPAAIANLRNLEQASSTKNEMYGDLQDEEWLALCQFRPKALLP